MIIQNEQMNAYTCSIFRYSSVYAAFWHIWSLFGCTYAKGKHVAMNIIERNCVYYMTCLQHSQNCVSMICCKGDSSFWFISFYMIRFGIVTFIYSLLKFLLSMITVRIFWCMVMLGMSFIFWQIFAIGSFNFILRIFIFFSAQILASWVSVRRGSCK